MTGDEDRVISQLDWDSAVDTSAMKRVGMPDDKLDVDRLTRALAVVGPVDVEDSMAGWTVYAADIARAYCSADSDDPTAVDPGGQG